MGLGGILWAAGVGWGLLKPHQQHARQTLYTLYTSPRVEVRMEVQRALLGDQEGAGMPIPACCCEHVLRTGQKVIG